MAKIKIEVADMVDNGDDDQWLYGDSNSNLDTAGTSVEDVKSTELVGVPEDEVIFFVEKLIRAICYICPWLTISLKNFIFIYCQYHGYLDGSLNKNIFIKYVVREHCTQIKYYMCNVIFMTKCTKYILMCTMAYGIPSGN